MVVVSIRSLFYDEEAGEQRYRQRATVIAQGNELQIEGDSGLVANGGLPVIDVLTGTRLIADDDPETWARNLPSAFRAGDLVAEILADSSPPAPVEAESEHREPPTLPDVAETNGCAAAQPTGRLSFGHS